MSDQTKPMLPGLPEAELLRVLYSFKPADPPYTVTGYTPDQVRAIQLATWKAAMEYAAWLCDEMGEHWSDYKNTALLNGDIELSNAASGEPRAAEFLAAAIRQAPEPGEGG